MIVLSSYYSSDSPYYAANEAYSYSWHLRIFTLGRREHSHTTYLLGGTL